MKTKNIIVITNLFNSNKAMAVKNFSDANVKEAIGKLMDINPEILQCEASSMNEGIYEVVGEARGLKDEVGKVYALQQESTIFIRVSYATLYE